MEKYTIQTIKCTICLNSIICWKETPEVVKSPHTLWTLRRIGSSVFFFWNLDRPLRFRQLCKSHTEKPALGCHIVLSIKAISFLSNFIILFSLLQSMVLVIASFWAKESTMFHIDLTEHSFHVNLLSNSSIFQWNLSSLSIYWLKKESWFWLGFVTYSNLFDFFLLACAEKTYLFFVALWSRKKVLTVCALGRFFTYRIVFT